MDIQKKDVDELNAVLTVTLTPEDYQPKVDKALQDYRKKANLPGFRKGMVPMGMVKKMVGKSALLEEVNKILSEEIDKYIKDNKIDILGQPLPKDTQNNIDWDNQEKFQFDFDMGLAPEIDVQLKNKKFEKYKVKIDDKTIDKQVEELSKRYGKVVEADSASADDIIYGQFVELDEKGEIKEGGIIESSTILLQSLEDKKTKGDLTGAKPGDKFTIEINKIWKPEDIAVRFHIDKDKLKEVNDKFQFTVEKVNRMIPAELNQEFFDKIFGKDVVSSEKEFREKVAADLAGGLAADTDYVLHKDIRKKLLEDLKIKLPDDFLKRWIAQANEKPITSEQIEEQYDDYAHNLKWQLIENKIVKENNIEVSWDEVVEHTQNLLREQFGKMGNNEVDEETLKETTNRVLTNKEETQRIYENLFQQKIIGFMKSEIAINEKEISYDEFLKKAYEN